MPGQYYCNGEISDCFNKEDCYKNGGYCHTTTQKEYAAAKRPEYRRRAEVERQLPQKKPDNFYTGSFWQTFVPAAVSVIAAFVTTLIIIPARM